MKLRNFCWSLKNKQINYYFSKLPEIYRTCDIPIIFVPDNRFGYIVIKYYTWKYNLHDLTFQEFNDCGGTHYHRNEKISNDTYKSKTRISSSIYIIS